MFGVPKNLSKDRQLLTFLTLSHVPSPRPPPPFLPPKKNLRFFLVPVHCLHQ